MMTNLNIRGAGAISSAEYSEKGLSKCEEGGGVRRASLRPVV